jgi:hypothetical protein
MPLMRSGTEVPAERTIQEITALLVRKGATSITTLYDGEQKVGLAFGIGTPYGDVEYRLPVDVAKVRAKLYPERPSVWEDPRQRAKREAKELAQAERTAWRICKAWVEAQIGAIEAGIITMDEVFMPWADVGGGVTLYQAIRGRGRLPLLGSGRE